VAVVLDITTDGDVADFAEGTQKRADFLNATAAAAGVDVSRLSLTVRSASVELTVVIAADSVGEADQIFSTLSPIVNSGNLTQASIAFGVAVLATPTLFEILPPSPPPSGGGGGHSKGGSNGTVVGAVVGAVVGSVLIGAGVACLLFRKRGICERLSLKQVSIKRLSFSSKFLSRGGSRWGSVAGKEDPLVEQSKGLEMQKKGLLATQAAGPSRIESLAAQNAHI